MDRRKFLSLLGPSVAGVALAQAIPSGRVWSFPKKIVCVNLQSPDALDEAFSESLRHSMLASWRYVGVRTVLIAEETARITNGPLVCGVCDDPYLNSLINS